MGRGKARKSLELIEASIEILREIRPGLERYLEASTRTRGCAGVIDPCVARDVKAFVEDGLDGAGWPWNPRLSALLDAYVLLQEIGEAAQREDGP